MCIVYIPSPEEGNTIIFQKYFMTVNSQAFVKYIFNAVKFQHYAGLP